MTDAETIEALAELLDTTPADLLEHAEKCPGCGTPTKYAPGIGPYCPSKACGRLDDLQPAETPKRMTDADVHRLLLSQASEACYCARSGLDPDLCERVCDSPSLTTEQARGFANRWAWWEAKKVECPDSWMFCSAGPAPLLGPGRAQLFVWVRVLGGVDEDHSVLALLAAFGWEYHAGYGSPSYTDALALLRAARSS